MAATCTTRVDLPRRRKMNTDRRATSSCRWREEKMPCRRTTNSFALTRLGNTISKCWRLLVALSSALCVVVVVVVVVVVMVVVVVGGVGGGGGDGQRGGKRGASRHQTSRWHSREGSGVVVANTPPFISLSGSRYTLWDGPLTETSTRADKARCELSWSSAGRQAGRQTRNTHAGRQVRRQAGGRAGNARA
jgi:hypothetical protein